MHGSFSRVIALFSIPSPSSLSPYSSSLSHTLCLCLSVLLLYCWYVRAYVCLSTLDKIILNSTACPYIRTRLGQSVSQTNNIKGIKSKRNQYDVKEIKYVVVSMKYKLKILESNIKSNSNGQTDSK